VTKPTKKKKERRNSVHFDVEKFQNIILETRCLFSNSIGTIHQKKKKLDWDCFWSFASPTTLNCFGVTQNYRAMLGNRNTIIYSNLFKFFVEEAKLYPNLFILLFFSTQLFIDSN
jgi:hypothetical protein